MNLAMNKAYQSQKNEREIIIHRTANCVIVNDNTDFLRRKEEREKKMETRGWNAPLDRPYQQFGDFANVLQAMEGVKINLPHTRGNMDQVTHRNLKVMKKINEPHSNMQTYIEPGRTLKILHQNQAQLKKLRASSQVTGSNHIQSFFHRKKFSNQDDRAKTMFQNIYNEDEEDQSRVKALIRAKNNKLNTSSMKKLILNNTDGGDVLKSEIADSYSRVKAVKHGALIRQLMHSQRNNSYSQQPETPIIEGSFKIQPFKNQDNDNTFITGLKDINTDLKTNYNISAFSTNLKTQTGYRTQPTSPVRKQLRFNLDQSYQDSSQFQDLEKVIYIPNYQNKKPKIIRMSDLNKLRAKQTRQSFVGSDGISNQLSPDATVLNSSMKISTQPFSFQDAANTAMGYQSSLMNSKKTQNSVNYHRKLQDEFDKYEMLFRDHYHMNNKDQNNEAGVPNGAFINSLISNQYINKHYNSIHPSVLQSGFQNVPNLGTPNNQKFMSRDDSMSESHSPSGKFNKYRQAKMSVVINQKVSPMDSSKNQKLQTGKKHTQSNQNSIHSSQNNQSNKDSQKILPKSFESKLKKSERDAILVSAITNSIKYQSEQDESKILQMLNEDQLWKECCYLLKEYFDVNFLNEIKDNKILVFRLYKLYLLHSLSLSVKQIDESYIQGGSPNKKGKGKTKNGVSDDVVTLDTDSSGDEGNYNGQSGNGVFKQKINGFIRLLQEILNPTEKDSLELDSVFQLKNLVKSYYEKKGSLAGNLTETLYAMLSERPQILESKKKYFFQSYEVPDQMRYQVKKIRNLYFELEQMRLNSERERISNYKEQIEQLLNGQQGATTKFQF